MNTTAELTDNMIDDTPLLFGRVLDGRGGGRPIGWVEAQGWWPADEREVMWLHLCRSAGGVPDWLEQALGIPEPTTELLTSDDTRPRAFRENGTLVATLRGINFNPGAEPEDMVSMQLWCDGRRLVTLRRLPLQTPRDVLGEIDGAGSGPEDAGALITRLTELLIQRMNRSIIDMNEQIDRLEELDLDEGDEADADAVLTRISAIRRNCLALQRHMGPQHVALEAIARDAPAWFEEHDRREMGETVALLRRFLDDIDVSKESAVVLMDEIRARAVARTERTNNKLTIVAATFLPLGFLTGLLGINVGGIPGSADPQAFWLVVALCGAIFAVQLYLFRKWDWL